MTRYHKTLGVCLVAIFGMWGCARGPSGSGSAADDKLKALEAKTAKVENELRSALAAGEQLRKKLSDAEETQTQMRQEIARLQLVEKERDELKVLLKTRTAERDLLHAKYEGFLQELDDLAGRARAALNNQSPKPPSSGMVNQAPENLKPANVGASSGAAGDAKPAGTGVAAGEPAGPALPGGS